jgi:hypothetical protein
MLFQNSRLANSAGPGRHFVALAASVVFCLASIGAFSANTAAQAQSQTQVTLTYLRDTEGPGGVVDTATSQFVRPGVARVSVFASFTGQGYGFFGGNQIAPSDTVPDGTAQVDNGEAFIVTPIIDPDLYLNYQLHNESGVNITSLTFTLDPSLELYFFQTQDFPTASTALLGTPLFGSPVSSLSFNGVQRDAFKSVTFSSLRGESLPIDGQGIFSLAIHVPEGQLGQKFYGIISPNGLPPLAVPGTSAPEPGSLALLLPAGIALGAAVRVKARRYKRVL